MVSLIIPLTQLVINASRLGLAPALALGAAAVYGILYKGFEAKGPRSERFDQALNLPVIAAIVAVGAQAAGLALYGFLWGMKHLYEIVYSMVAAL